MKNKDRPAFANEIRNELTPNPIYTGLTKREEFAKAAMQGFIAFSGENLTHPDRVQSMIGMCYLIADMMLEEKDSEQ